MSSAEKEELQTNNNSVKVRDEEIRAMRGAGKDSTGAAAKYVRQLGPEEAYRRGLMKETWCHVEGKKEQVWLTSKRRHFPEVHNMSTLFNDGLKVDDEPRCEWKVKEAVNRKERRHFLNKGLTHLTI